MQPSPSLLLSLGYATTASSALLGWMSLGQTAVTLALELLVALHYASLRTLHAAGVVAEVNPLYKPSNGVRPTAGQPLSPEDRALVSRSERRILATICIGAGTLMALGAGDALVSSWGSLATWVVLTATLLAGERQRYRAWLASDAPLTADPLTQTRHVTHRVMVFAAVLLFGTGVLASSNTAGALLLIGTAWLMDLVQQRSAHRRPDAEAH